MAIIMIKEVILCVIKGVRYVMMLGCRIVNVIKTIGLMISEV